MEPASLPAELPQISDQQLQQMNPGHRQMVVALRELAIRSADKTPYVGDHNARRMRWLAEMLKTNPQTPRTAFAVYDNLAQAELVLGNEEAALEAYTLAEGVLPELEDMVDPDSLDQFLFRIGVAYLRRAESQNCCQRNNPESCILPIQGGGLHDVQESAREAIKYFTRVLRNQEQRAAAESSLSDLYFQARWLLNLAYMTVGEHPQNVPESYVIPAEAFRGQTDFPAFENIATDLGIDSFSCAGGTIADDFDRDGYIDLVVSSWHPASQLRYFRNDQAGGFVERTDEAGLTGILGGLNLIQGDYNNDDQVDILVLRGGWLPGSTEHMNSLLCNNGDGTFTDVTFDALLAEPALPTQTGVWADFNNDGNLDIYIGNENAPCQLFINSGDGRFEDRGSAAGVTNDRFTKAVVAGDYDNDGFIDIYASNNGEKNRLYRNQGDGSFSDMAEVSGVMGPRFSFPCWFWDFDNDGALDLFVSDYSTTVGDIARSYLGMEVQWGIDRLYRGDGAGGFRNVAADVGLTRPSAPMGSNFGDLNNDGYLDFYLGTGNVPFESVMPNLMYVSRDAERFEDVTTPGRFGHLQKGHGVVFADFDRDGDQDVFEQMGGALAGDKFYDAYYQNPGFGKHYLAVRLSGVVSNRGGVAAQIKAVVQEDGVTREIHRRVGSGGSFGANPLQQHLGVGKADRIVRLEVYWPASGVTQIFEDLAVDQRILIVEGQPQVLRLP